MNFWRSLRSTKKPTCHFFIGTFVLLFFSANPAYCKGSFFDASEVNRKNSCQGYYSLTFEKRTSSREYWILRNNTNNIASIDLTEPSARINLYACLDIDNDGQKEAVVEYYTLGAHCCFEYLFYKKEKAGLKRFQHIYLGNASRPVFQDINKDGKLEILTLNDSFAYFAGLCYACSPAVPLILCYRDREFSDCTSEFPAILGRLIKENLRKKEEQPLYKRGVALEYLLLNILRGKREEGWRGIRKYYPEAYPWLRENRREINEILDGRKFNER